MPPFPFAEMEMTIECIKSRLFSFGCCGRCVIAAGSALILRSEKETDEEGRGWGGGGSRQVNKRRRKNEKKKIREGGKSCSEGRVRRE